jgi:transposase
MREIVNAICYVLRGGIAWRLVPDCFPPWNTVYQWFARLRDDDTWQTINHHLVMRDRKRVGREASPTAAVLDSQSVKTTESGGLRGYDAGKKIKGRKRHAMVDTDGRALKLHVHAEVDMEMKAKALASVDISGLQNRPWQRPLPSLMTFLKAL